MRGKWSPFRLPPRWRWLTWPIFAFGAAGSIVALWLEEEPLVMASEVCPALAALAAMGALLCRLCDRMFEAAKPRPQDTRHDLHTK
jgi:hypothetical protein